MAVKFKRDPNQKFDWNIRGRSIESVRKRTLYIYAGLAVAFIASLAVHLIGQGVGSQWTPSVEGTATIREKFIQSADVPQPRYFVRCEVEVPQGLEEVGAEATNATTTMSDLVITDEASFALVEEGGTINVMYRVKRDYSSMKIHRMILHQTTVPADPQLEYLAPDSLRDDQ